MGPKTIPFSCLVEAKCFLVVQRHYILKYWFEFFIKYLIVDYLPWPFQMTLNNGDIFIIVCWQFTLNPTLCSVSLHSIALFWQWYITYSQFINKTRSFPD